MGEQLACRRLLNGLKIQWRGNFVPTSSSTKVSFLFEFSEPPALFITPHRNANDSVQLDCFGFNIDKTGFYTDFFTGSTIDYLAIGY